MVRITKEEAAELRKRFGKKAYVYRLNKQRSKRHNYLASEDGYIIKALEEIRGCAVDTSV